MSTTFQDSRKFTLKRHPSSGSANIAAPATSAYSGGLYVTNYTVAHNLGYIPQFRVEYEPFGDGVLYPDLASRQSGYASNPLNLTQAGPGLIYWADGANLYIQLFYYNNSLTGTFPVTWVVYI